jgi:hypothetical protein
MTLYLLILLEFNIKKMKKRREGSNTQEQGKGKKCNEIIRLVPICIRKD